MIPIRTLIVSLVAIVSAAAAGAAEPEFIEGRQYTRLTPAVPVTVGPGKIEVAEVFSYGCPACFAAQATVLKLKASLPPNAQLVFVPAAFNPSEAWPMFQRAYLTAQVMGVAEQAHAAMFEAIWSTGELPLVDPATRRMRPKLPTIEDAARFYAKHAGVKEAEFLATAKSFAVETRISQAEQRVRAFGADSTPTFVVNGKYRIEPAAVGSYDGAAAVVRYLVAKESAQP
jgi:protein dithiol oxidoreductase (disulfide-forming)